MDKTSDLVRDFFDLSKNVKKLTIRGGAVMGHVVPKDDFYVQQSKTSQIASGQDYAKEFVEREEKGLLENGLDAREASCLPPSPNPQRLKGNLNEMEDLTSVGSIANLADVEDDDWSRVYRNFKFDPPPSKNLVIEDSRDAIVRMIDTNQVVVIEGSTGCGKTTQVPQYILDHHVRLNKRCNIIVTQPRRIAAISVAKRVCEERNWGLGTIVGYQIGMDIKTCPDTRLTFCTTGVLREKLVKERSMMAYTHVILDEVHERDIDMDFLLLVVRKLLRTNSRTVKVILMSATINTKKFAEYFSSPVFNRLEPAPIMNVNRPNRSYKVHEHYLNQLEKIGPLPKIEHDNPTIEKEAYDVAVKLIKYFDKIDFQEFQDSHNALPNDNIDYKHAVLVFLPGLHEIEQLLDRLEEKRENKYNWHIIPLHSSISREEQQQVFSRQHPGYRKIILSTNIAESSITVPDVGYVIDFCLTKHLISDPLTNFSCLQLSWASQSNCIQRKGRAGRVKRGRVYRMVPESFYQALPEDCLPEMLRCPLEQTVLKAKMLKMGEPKAILALALDPPDLGRLERTILVLKEVGAMLSTCEGKPSRFDGDVTFLGHVMAHLPLDIHLTKLIMLGHLFSILDDSIIIAALMSVRNVFNNSFHDRLSTYGAKLTYADGTNSDCIAYLHLFRMFKEKQRTNFFRITNTSQEAFFRRSLLNLNALREADTLYTELQKRLEMMGVSEPTAHGRVIWESHLLPIIRKVVIAGAFYPNYFVRGAQGGQIDERDAVKLLSGKDPKNSVYLQGMPPNQPGVLYTKVFKDALKVCGTVKDVTFDGSSKVFIEFERPRKETIRGKISIAVYRAIRLRQLRIPIVVPCLPLEEAHRRVEKMGLETSSLLAIAGKCHEDEEKSCKSFLPQLETQFIDFTPCNVEDPSRFWIHSSVSTELNWISNALNTPGNVYMLSEPIKLGHMYAVPYPVNGEVMYRAQIFSVATHSASVLYIDYGNVEGEVPLKYIYEVSPTLLESEGMASIPPLALECTLTGIAPLTSLDDKDLWPEKAKKRFTELLNCTTLYGEVYSVVDGLVSLIVKRPNEETSVNEILIAENLAIRSKESYRSVENNELRVQARNYCYGETKKNFQSLQPKQDFKLGTEDPEPPSPSRDSNTIMVTLRGPMNPLEMKVYGCTQIAGGKEVSIDLQSVNAALLDNDPEDPHERLLIAASVAQNPSGSRLKLVHTTLMPNIHGLSALMCLIFAPTIELRRSPDKSHFIGALCGLGYDEKTSESYFPEHDMEIVFDCKVDLVDLLDINKLRYWMSVPLEADSGGDTPKATLHEILTSQQKVREFLLLLLQRNWEPQSVLLFRRPYQWNQFDSDDLLDPGLKDPSQVYKPHWGLMLNDE